MNRIFTRLCACTTAVCASFALTAQDDGAGDAAAAGDGQALVASAAKKSTAKHFHTLVKLAFANDNVSVKLPRQAEFKPACEGKFYPNGSVFRVTETGGDPAVFEFGPEVLVKVAGAAEFATREVALTENARSVMIMNGTVTVSLPRTMPTGLFSVAYPNFTAKDLAGESNHTLTATGDGDEATVHVVTGMLALDGSHYKVARMGAADRIRIRTTAGALFTSLRGEAGDCKVTLDQGVTTYRDPVSGEKKEQVRHLDYNLTPQCAIKIFRKRSQVGGRMAVSVMTFDPAGEIRNRYTFAEGTAAVNFGEEIVRVQDISFKTKSNAKKTAKEGDAAAPAEAAQEQSGDALSSGSGDSGSGEAAGDSGFGSF